MHGVKSERVERAGKKRKEREEHVRRKGLKRGGVGRLGTIALSVTVHWPSTNFGTTMRDIMSPLAALLEFPLPIFVPLRKVPLLERSSTTTASGSSPFLEIFVWS